MKEIILPQILQVPLPILVLIITVIILFMYLLVALVFPERFI